MKAFTIRATIRFRNGKEEPFTASFSDPIYDESRGFICRFETSAFHGGTFHTPYPEISYARALSHVRQFVEAYPWELLNEKREVFEMQPPLVDEAGVATFPVMSLQGEFQQLNGRQRRFWARIEPPVKNKNGTFGCLMSCSLHDFSDSINSEWPDHSYELAFNLLRKFVSRQDGGLRDKNGEPLVIAAIPRD